MCAIGTGSGGAEITEDEYNEILSVIRSRPTPPEGYGYRLKTDLTWEQYELPPAPPPDPNEEISGDELAAMLEVVL